MVFCIFAIMDFQEYSIKFDLFVKSLEKDIDNIFVDMLPDFVEANKRALMKGQKSDGSHMSVLRNPFYVDYKERKGSFAATLSPPRSDVKDTGSFQNKMLAKSSPNIITILSTDSKMSKLVEKNGIDLFGVQKIEYPQLSAIFALRFKKVIDAKLL